MRDLPFLITQKLKWEGLPFRENGGAAPPTERGRELFARYDLKRWSEQWSELTLDEVLGALDVLDQVPGDLLPDLAVVNALDIGSKNWRYLGALVAWLESRFPRAQFELTGIELDAYRIGPNLRTWIAAGKHFAKLYQGSRIRTRYVAGDIRSHQSSANVVFWLFPFVSENPHRAWGLPKRLFCPDESFIHVVTRCLQPGGSLILANHGDWEYEIARDLLGKIPGICLRHESEIRGSLHPSPHPVQLSVWTFNF